MKILFGVVISVLNFWICSTYSNNVEKVFHWKDVRYENLPISENYYIGPYRYYIPENNDIIGTGYHPASGLMLVVIARIRPGIPTSLGAFCVNDHKQGSSPKIWGFPDYPTNTLRASDFIGGSLEDLWRKIESEDDEEFRKGSIKPNKLNHHYVHQVPVYETPVPVTYEEPSEPARIISIFYVTVDERCNRLFAMDNGHIQYYRNSTYAIQKPALLVIDLPSDGCETRNFPIIKRAELPDKIIAKGSNGFMAVTLDYVDKGSCDDLFLYIPNAFYSYLVVYDYKNDEFWYFDHETFKPVIAESHMIFDKTFNYDVDFGIYSIALGNPDKSGYRTAYYTPLASTAQFSVSTKVLRNNKKSPLNPNDFTIMGYRGCSHQSVKMIFDETHGVMFYIEVQSNQIRCWNINKPLNPDNIAIVYESEKLLLGLGLSIDSQGYLWFHSCHIPIDYLTDQPLKLDEVNSRIFRVKVSDAIRGTICED